MDITTHTIPEAIIMIADDIETTAWADGHVTTRPADQLPDMTVPEPTLTDLAATQSVILDILTTITGA